MKLIYKILDSTTPNFDVEFSDFEESFFAILVKAYTTFYGREYHNERIKSGRAIIYTAFVDNELIGVSYVKRNLRRGGIAIYPEKFRRLGIAGNLINLSLNDFPEQYSILSTNLPHSHKMLSLMSKLGFVNGKSIDEIKNITGEGFKLLSNFHHCNGYFVFDRTSERRGLKREVLTLMHTFNVEFK